MRFITEDTNKGDVKDPLSLNLYTYCVGNPISYIDPSGNYYENWAGDFRGRSIFGVDGTWEIMGPEERMSYFASAAAPFVTGFMVKGSVKIVEVAAKASNYVPQNDKWISAGKTMFEWIIENKYKTKIGGGTDIGKIFVYDQKGKLIGEIHSGQEITQGVLKGTEYQTHYQPYTSTGKIDSNFHLWFND